MRRLPLTVALAAVGFAAACQPDDSPTYPDLVPSAQLARSTAQLPNTANVLLNRPATPAILAELSRYGRIRGQISELNAVFMGSLSVDYATLRALPFVADVGEDAERSAGPPLPPVAATNFANGVSTWDLDAVGVTDLAVGRTVTADGAGVYVGVLDTGLLSSWRFYFPDERIAEEYAVSFGGGGAQSRGATSTQPGKWERDIASHGSHVTSSILGFRFGNGVMYNGVAPMATVIPVKVLNNNGSGWSSAIAAGIVYIANLKTGPLAGSPVVINMSLGGSILDPVEKAAVDYAITRGVIIVASAGNQGAAGMGYPGAYEPVISVGATGWTGEWTGTPPNAWWSAGNVAEPTSASDFYVTSFSSREKTNQDLDVLAPGSWVVGPWQTNQGAPSYFFVGGTSMASPHVAGLVALMTQADGGLTAAEAEAALESTAIPLPAGSRNVLAGPGGPTVTYTWADDANGSGMVSAAAALAAVGGS
jgi:subtilisin family serine protease